MTGIIEITATIKVTSEGGLPLYFKMGEQFAFSEIAKKPIPCGECSDESIYIDHYKVLHPQNNDIVYWLRKDYAVIVSEWKPENQRIRQQYYQFERIGKDTTTDFVKQTKELLGIDIHQYKPDIATDPEIEKAIARTLGTGTIPSVNAD